MTGLGANAPSIRWSTQQIAAAEGIDHPSDLGLIADLHRLAETVAMAPPEMLDAALDDLVDLMGLLPPDAVFPVLSQVIDKRPDAIKRAVADGSRVGRRVAHMERTVFVAALFFPARVAAMTRATNRVLESLRGSEPELE